MNAPHSSKGSATPPVLTVEDLGVGFFPSDDRRLPVVEDVSFTLRDGRTTAVVGESGCGKSMMAAALGGLLPRGMKHDRGRVRWADGRPVEAGRGMAYVFQDPGACLDPVFTIGNQIRETLPREDRRRAAARVEELLRMVGFDEPSRVAASYAHQLSGGMQQRAMLAIALAVRPRVLVADEPTTALDVTVQKKILDLLKSLQAATHMAVLLITHNLGVVADVADELLVMYAGRMMEAGGLGVLKAPLHPYVQGLLHSLPTLEGPAQRLTGIPGMVPALGRHPPGCAFHPRCPVARAICHGRRPEFTEVGLGHGMACWAAVHAPEYEREAAHEH